MDWADGYIAIDWGTTNRRAYRIDRGGRLADSVADDRGVLAMAVADYAAEVGEIRQRLGDLPVLLAGMVGSNRGWREAPYIECPAGVDALARAIVWVEPGRTGIVPGVCQRKDRADVMRGEEVQAIGAQLAGLVPDGALVCYPGTHAKWIVMREGKIEAFHTTMTGEVFALLQTHSILADQMRGTVTDSPTFRYAARLGLSGANPIAELFGIRARHLLGDHADNGAAVASGLLIGADLRSGLAGRPAGPVALVGQVGLCTLYAAALEEAGRTAVVIDGSTAFLAGMTAITEIL